MPWADTSSAATSTAWVDVDGVGRVLRVLPQGAARQVWYASPPELLPLVAAKGSICIDGTSLTVNEVDHVGFSVGLVPHTLAATTLGDHGPGDEVNLEVDVIARYVARLLAVVPDREARLRAAVLDPAYPEGEER
jgi:riboflavin synthase